MIVIAGYCASRLVVSYRWRRETAVDADGTHILMGVAMAGMLAPRLNPGWDGILVVVFGVAATWFARQTANAWRGSAVPGPRCASPAPHLLECAAMLYMLLAGPAGAGGRGLRTSMGGASAPAVAAGHLPVVALALALMLFGDVVLTTDRLTCAARWANTATRSLGADATAAACARRAHSGGPPALAPRLAACCKIAMAITMGYMLILTL
jgi:Domain of unknown function (DUF5134)